MKSHIVSTASILVAIAALAMTWSARQEVAAMRTEYRAQSANTDRDERIAALTVRVEAFEKQLGNDGRNQLLSDIIARLELAENLTGRNTQETRSLDGKLRGTIRDMNDALNEVSKQFVKLNSEVTRMKEPK